MRAAVALLLTLTMTLAGCFPHDPHKQTIAKAAEGGSLIVGIVISALANTGADCDSNNTTPGSMDTDCHKTAHALDVIGVSLILAGLLGFIATVSTAEDDAKPQPVTVPNTTPPNTTPTTTTTPPATNTTNTQATDPGAGTTAGSGAGSAGEGSGSATTTPAP